MKLSNFAAYIAQLWRNKPDTSTPLSAERLRHIEDGIKGNSDAIEAIAAAVVNQIVNDPDKIASMAALYAVNQKVSALDGKVGDTAQLPDGATDVVTAITKQNSDFACAKYASDIFVKTNGLFVYYNANTKNSPYKAGTTLAAEGLCLITGDPDAYFSAFSFDKGSEHICVYYKTPSGVTNWKRLV